MSFVLQNGGKDEVVAWLFNDLLLLSETPQSTAATADGAGSTGGAGGGSVGPDAKFTYVGHVLLRKREERIACAVLVSIPNMQVACHFLAKCNLASSSDG